MGFFKICDNSLLDFSLWDFDDVDFFTKYFALAFFNALRRIFSKLKKTVGVTVDHSPIHPFLRNQYE